jgi:hypothetical protein
MQRHKFHGALRRTLCKVDAFRHFAASVEHSITHKTARGTQKLRRFFRVFLYFSTPRHVCVYKQEAKLASFVFAHFLERFLMAIIRPTLGAFVLRLRCCQTRGKKRPFRRLPAKIELRRLLSKVTYVQTRVSLTRIIRAAALNVHSI